jgi:hypothetical protein
MWERLLGSQCLKNETWGTLFVPLRRNPTICISSVRQNRHPERSASHIYSNRGLYGAESKDPGDACWQMLLGAFWPQTTTEDKKSHKLRGSRPVPPAPACRGACRGGICSFSTGQQPQARSRFIYSASTLRASMIGPWNSSCSTKA